VNEHGTIAGTLFPDGTAAAGRHAARRGRPSHSARGVLLLSHTDSAVDRSHLLTPICRAVR